MVDLAVLAENSVKMKESGKKDNDLDLVSEQKKNCEHENDGDIICIFVTASHQT